jgi:hypothetical protein
MQATGFVQPGFPSMGAWISYGLGSANENLPTFVVLPDRRGFAPNGPKNWAAGFLPAEHQGTLIRPSAETPIADLFPPEGSFVRPEIDRDTLAVLNQLYRRHHAERPGDSRLDARIRSYELAARMQLSAPEILDLSQEPQYIQDMYGLNDPDAEDFGRNCLITRRLLEKGVRFVQLWSGADNGFPRRNWDSHEDLQRDHGPLGRGLAIGAAALIKDLKQRGLLDDTVILWTTEFGRMPCSQGSKGRDHNPFTFTSWLAGGGIKGGMIYGSSDATATEPDFDPVGPADLATTVYNQLGIVADKELMSPGDRPVEIVDGGKLIKPLLV